MIAALYGFLLGYFGVALLFQATRSFSMVGQVFFIGLGILGLFIFVGKTAAKVNESVEKFFAQF